MRRTALILILIHFLYMLLVKGIRKQRESATAGKEVASAKILVETNPTDGGQGTPTTYQDYNLAVVGS